jgi:hypothetical protein
MSLVKCNFNVCHFILQYIQIAENVLSKLPSSMLLPETRHLQQIKETTISSSENAMVAHHGEDENVNEDENDKNATADDDLV